MMKSERLPCFAGGHALNTRYRPRVGRSSRCCMCMSQEDARAVSRRAVIRGVIPFLFGSFAVAPAALATDARTVVNAALSAYFIPVQDSKSYSKLVQQFSSLVVELKYPNAWVVSNLGANRTRAGGTLPAGKTSPLSVSNYRTAESATLYVSDASSKYKTIDDVSLEDIARLVLPGDATRSYSEYSVIRRYPLKSDPTYAIFQFEFSSTTTSGDDVQRYCVTSATVLKGCIIALAASCTSQRFKSQASVLQTVVESFRASWL